MENTFTKGPWKLDENPHWVKGKDGIGDVCRISNHSGYENLRGTDLANAHLIAAAPDLLEALQELLDSVNLLIDSNLRNKCKEAISKALNKSI